MKRLATIVGAGALVLALFPASVAAAGPAVFTASLIGASEVPSVSTAAAGAAQIVISASGASIDYQVTYSGLSGPLAAAHIHVGAVGANGGIIFPLVAGPSPMVGSLTTANFTPSGSITTYAQAVAAIEAGNTYVNFHTAANPGGEIRGQLAAATGAVVLMTSLAGSAEVPSVSTAASGSALVVIYGGGTSINYQVTYSGLSGAVVASHIHDAAMGTNGPIILPLTAGPSPMVGILTAADFTPGGGITTYAQAIAAMEAGGTYVNLHTAAHPGGEVRGQLNAAATSPSPTPTPTPSPAPSARATPPPTSTVATATDTSAPALPAAVVLLAAAALGLIVFSYRRAGPNRAG